MDHMTLTCYVLFGITRPMQSVSIATDVVSLNLNQGEVYYIQQYVIRFVSDF